MITTYQIRNVLRVYGNQLKKRSEENGDHGGVIPQRIDIVDISIEARRKQILSRMSNQLISKIHAKELQKRAEEKPGGYIQAEGPELIDQKVK